MPSRIAYHDADMRSLRGIGPGPAVVLGLNPNALGTIRSLAREGIDVVAVGPTPDGHGDSQDWMSARTRLARTVRIARDRWPGALVDVLMDGASHWTGRAVLIPSSDVAVEALLRERDRLSNRFEIVLPEARVVEELVDKVSFCRVARERGVPVPVTVVGVTTETVDQVANGLRFPCIIKPALRDGAWDERFGVHKVLECEDRAALIRSFQLAVTTHRSLVIQEVIPGPDDQIVFSHAYVGRDGRERAMWTGRKMRQHPIHFGSATMAALEWIPEVAALTRKLLSGTPFVGYASVEFKFDARDGVYRAIEATIGRTCYHHALGLAAKVNIPAMWYRDALGQPVAVAEAHYNRSVWIDEYRDVAAVLDYVHAGELSLSQAVRSLRGSRSYAHLAWNDPVPGMYLGARLILGATRVMVKKAAAFLTGS